MCNVFAYVMKRSSKRCVKTRLLDATDNNIMEPKQVNKNDVRCGTISETYGSSSVKNVYNLVSTNEGHIYAIKASTSKREWQHIKQFFRSVFLPQGFPESVSEDYLQYQIWDTVQAFSSGITGALATQAVLKGVGVGDESATVLAATITWLMKDGVSMVGRILFAWRQSSYLDSDCKRWRLFADIVNDVSIFLDIMASHFTLYFRLIVCLSGLCRALVGVAGGATRAALTQHQARRNNMADVSAKDGSQETMVNLAALICSLILIPIVSGNPELVWTLFVIFTSLHLYANYSAITAVRMETFNQARLHLVVSSALQQVHRGHERKIDLGPSHVLGVKQANYLEPVLWKSQRKFRINLGCQLQQLSNLQVSLSEVLSTFRKSSYLLSIDLRKDEINIVLHLSSQFTEQLKACYHALVLEYCYTVSQSNGTMMFDDFWLNNSVAAIRDGNITVALRESLAYVQSSWPTFCERVESVGWKTSPVQLCADEWRSEWN